jgi:prevent-host-death family protein
MESVGIRELRQNASEIVRHVEETGTNVEVTVQGRPTVVISPKTTHRRARSLDSSLVKEALAGLPSDEEWAAELHASRENDPVIEPQDVGRGD